MNFKNFLSLGHTGALCEDCDIYGNVWGEPYAKIGYY